MYNLLSFKNKIRFLLPLILNTCFITQAQAYCWGTGNLSACLYYVPTYDQTSNQIPSAWFPGGVNSNSQLCAPTSSAMAYQALLQDLTIDKPVFTGWISKSFKGKSMSDQIVATASMLGTDVNNGTSLSGFKNFAGQANDYDYQPNGNTDPRKNPMSFYYYKNYEAITFDYFKTHFNTGKSATVISYGHYTQNKVKISTPISNQITVSYVRNGGHVLAPRGYIQKLLVFNDPEGGIIQFSEIPKVFAGISKTVSGNVTTTVQTVLPNNAHSLSYIQIYQAGTYYPLMEDFQALTTPFNEPY